jgi:hypothetical protein
MLHPSTPFLSSATPRPSFARNRTRRAPRDCVGALPRTPPNPTCPKTGGRAWCPCLERAPIRRTHRVHAQVDTRLRTHDPRPAHRACSAVDRRHDRGRRAGSRRGCARRPRPPGGRSGRRGRQDRGHRRPPDESFDLVRGRRLRRRVEDDERRDDLDAHLRRPAELLDRLRRDRPGQPRCRVGRHRRERQRPARRLGHRPVPESGRREDLAERRARGVRAHRQNPRASRGRKHRARGRRGSALVFGRRPRRLPHAGRRRDVVERALHQRGHGGNGPRVRSLRSGRRVRRSVPAPPSHLGADVRRRALRDLEVDGRRSNVARAVDRAASRRHGQDRAGGDACGSESGVRHDRGERRGARLLPLDRQGRELGEAQPLHLGRHRRSRRRRPSRTS